METGAIILCGGESTRMGCDKALLPFGPESMLQRVVRLLGEAVRPDRTVIVAAAHQRLPLLPAGVITTRDERPERGPLEGLAAGLRAAPSIVDTVYVSSCDVPLLVPAFVRRMFELLEVAENADPRAIAVPRSFDIAVPRDRDFYHPLAAVYRRSVLPCIERLLAADRLGVRLLFDEARTRAVFVEDLRPIDPQLDTLKNLNTPEEYQAALRAAELAEGP
jgi:molybdopterin-guanine dinucleotide biosynthesis protein A